MEEEIVHSISRVLDLAHSQAKPMYVPSEAARDLYWRARYVNRAPISDRPGAIRLLQQAIAMEPKYVDAWSALSAQHALVAIHQEPPYPQTVAIAKETIRRTLELDPNDARAHAALDAVLNAWAYFTYSFALMEHHRFDDSLEALRKARALDPLSQAVATDLATIYFDAHRYDDSLREARSILKAAPDHINALWILAVTLSHAGQYQEADATFQKVLERTRRDPITLARYGAGLVRAGKRAEAEAVLNELLTGKYAAVTLGVHLAYVYAALGENAKALDCLDKSYAHHDTDMIFLGVDPAFDTLRSEPRFIAIKNKMGL